MKYLDRDKSNKKENQITNTKIHASDNFNAAIEKSNIGHSEQFVQRKE